MSTTDTPDPVAPAAAESTPAAPARKRSRAKPKAPAEAAAAADSPAADAPQAEAVSEPAADAAVAAPAKRSRRAKPKAAAQASDAAGAEPQAAADAAPAAPAADGPAIPTQDAPSADTAPAKRSRRRRAAEPVAEPVSDGVVESVAQTEAQPEAEVPPVNTAAAAAGDAPTATAHVTDAASPVAEVPAEPQAESQAEPLPERARIALATGAPVFQPGRDTPPRLLERLQRWQDRQGHLTLPDADALVRLLGELQQASERVDVDEAVWALLARRGDLNQRIDHLSALYPQGLDGLALSAGGQVARACQLEGAFFAACVARCAVADEAELSPALTLALAWQLVQRHFGAERLVVCAPEASRAEWQALLAGDGLPALRFIEQAELATAGDAEVLIVDARAGLPAGVPALPDSPWLWLLAPATLLAERDSAAAWLNALDRLGGHAVADWLGGEPAGVLAPLLLARRFADVAEQWPAWAAAERAVEHTDEEQATLQALHQGLRDGLARWQRSGFCSDSDQLALQRQLRGCEQLARAAAAGALVPAVQQALAGGAKRVVVFTGDEALLTPLAEVLQGEYLPAHALPVRGEVEAALRQFRDADDARVLLVADDPLGPRIATHPHRPVVVLLDGADDAALREARLARLRSPRVLREVPVWQLRAPAAPSQPPLPATGLLRGEALAAWLAQLQLALAPAPSVAAATPEA